MAVLRTSWELWEEMLEPDADGDVLLAEMIRPEVVARCRVALWPDSAVSALPTVGCLGQQRLVGVDVEAFGDAAEHFALASSLACMARPSWFWAFWMMNTIQNVTMVVNVLINSW